jgi:hypothetical protein
MRGCINRFLVLLFHKSPGITQNKPQTSPFEFPSPNLERGGLKLKFHPFSRGEKGIEDRGTEASPLLSKGEGNSKGEV